MGFAKWAALHNTAYQDCEVLLNHRMTLETYMRYKKSGTMGCFTGGKRGIILAIWPF